MSRINSSTRRKFPPYALRIHKQRLQGDLESKHIIVCIGPDGWTQAKRLIDVDREGICVLPWGDEASAYSWKFVRGYDVSIFEYGGYDPDNLYRLCAELLKAGAELVWCVPTGKHYRPVPTHGVREAV